MSNERSESLDALLDSVVDRDPATRGMTEFQLRNFVLGSQPTVWGAYRQACLEISQRREARETLRTKAKLLCVDLKELQLKGDERSVIQAEAIKRELDKLKAGIKDIERELGIIGRAARELKSKLPDETWDEHQPEYWVKKLWREAWSALVTAGSIPRDVVQAAMSLPENERKAFLNSLRTHEALPDTNQLDAAPRDGGCGR